MVVIEKIIYPNKSRIPWKDVANYMKQYEGQTHIITEYGDEIKLNYISASEYASSNYTKKLRGALAKAKANAVQIIPELIQHATNKRWIENKSEKHSKNAINGWYRYDVWFAMIVYDPETREKRKNSYRGTLVVRSNDNGLYFYDIIDIKKRDSTLGESNQTTQ